MNQPVTNRKQNLEKANETNYLTKLFKKEKKISLNQETYIYLI